VLPESVIDQQVVGQPTVAFLGVLEEVDLGLGQKPFNPDILLLQLNESPWFLHLHAAEIQQPVLAARFRHLDHAEDVGNGVALGYLLLGFYELVGDLPCRVIAEYHGNVYFSYWSPRDSQSL
jgi:hypothetical protein